MKNKIALVTGGTSGIGKEIVKELLQKGCKVVTCYSTNENNAIELKKEFNSDDLTIVKCDVSDEKQVIDMIVTIKNKYSQLDYLVNNAGTFIDNFIKEFDIDNLFEKYWMLIY